MLKHTANREAAGLTAVYLILVNCGDNAGHPSGLLRYLPLKGRKLPETLRSLVVSEGRECRNYGPSRQAICTTEYGHLRTFNSK